MYQTPTRPETSRKRLRQLLTAVRNAPRKLRIAGLAGVITLAGTAALVAVPAAASASAASCPLPTSVVWTRTGFTFNPTQPELGLTVFWETTYNGVSYTGSDGYLGLPPNETPATPAGRTGYCAAA